MEAQEVRNSTGQISRMRGHLVPQQVGPSRLGAVPSKLPGLLHSELEAEVSGEELDRGQVLLP
eukprot:4187375-Alexandrium_andersonii.AAC.1